MKKFLIVALSVAVLICCIVPTSAFAAFKQPTKIKSGTKMDLNGDKKQETISWEGYLSTDGKGNVYIDPYYTFSMMERGSNKVKYKLSKNSFLLKEQEILINKMNLKSETLEDVIYRTSNTSDAKKLLSKRVLSLSLFLMMEKNG